MNYKLVLVIFLALILRIYLLGVQPAGFNADEAALGYNAYSLLLTGKDEHGHVIPVNLESFGDFKPALYSYLVLPLIGILGLNEFAVRLPSALMGTLCVYVIYLTAKLTIDDFKVSNLTYKKLKHAPLISALALTISPWHLHFSRGAWEVNVATTFILIGYYLALKWVKKHKWYLITLSVVCFTLSMYTYQSARLIAPLVGIILFIINWRLFISNIKQSLITLIILFSILLPLGLTIVSSDAGSRLNGVGLLSDEGPLNRVKEFRGQYPQNLALIGKVLHNRPVIYSLQFIKNYIIHFDGDYLFVNGDKIDRNKTPESGLLYITDIIFILVGLLVICKVINLKSKYLISLIGWLIVSPIASALTFQVPHALRSQNMIIPLVIIISIGMSFVISIFRNKSNVGLYIGISAILLLYGYQLSRYLHEYYAHYEYDYPSSWEYGFKYLSNYIKENEYKYNKILITDKYDQPYIIILFYLKYPPAQFQRNHSLTFRDKFNFSTVKSFDKYLFDSTNWNRVRDMHNQLIIAAPEDIPNVGANVIDVINFPNGNPVFKIVAN